MMKLKLLVVTAVFSIGIVFAQETTKIEQLDSVQLDTKITMPRINSGKVVSRITSEIIEKNAGKTVSELINTVSGIEINGANSNEGQNLGYFVRGGRNRQVVIMIDGVQLNDPSLIANDYDLRLIPASSIEEIEIIKGASSVLYGSGAATAVINITTKKASKKPVTATFSSILGSNRAAETSGGTIEEFTNYVAVNGTLKRFFYNLNFSNRYAGGLSAIAAPEDEPAFEEDVFDRVDGKINLGVRLHKNILVSQFFSFDKYKAGFDDFSYTDANYQSRSRQLRTGGHFEWKYKRGAYVFNDSYSWIEREIMSSYPVKYDARTYSLDNYLTYRISSEITALLGLNYNSSRFNSFTIPFGGSEFGQDVSDEIAKFEIVDPYVNLVYVSDFGLSLNTGARLNIHSSYDEKIVYNINPSYRFSVGGNSLKILGSYSTAYITPSLFQLFDPFYGNDQLQPEENTTIEGGLEFTAENNLRFSAVYFSREESNYVDFVNVDPELYIYQYLNIDDDFNASGVEVELSKKIGTHLDVSGNYTFTQADERFSSRIPKHKWNALVNYKIGSATSLGLSYLFTGEREDAFFDPVSFESQTTVLHDYGLLNFSASRQFSKNLKLFAAINNILNEEFEELYRFQSKGRNIRAGFELSF
jgi:vitamin B12 transporter